MLTSETRHNEAIRRGRAAFARYAETRTIAREVEADEADESADGGR